MREDLKSSTRQCRVQTIICSVHRWTEDPSHMIHVKVDLALSSRSSPGHRFNHNEDISMLSCCSCVLFMGLNKIFEVIPST